MNRFVLPWTPSGVNANHMYLHTRRGVRLRPEVQGWRDEITLLVRQGEPFPDGPLHVSIGLSPPGRQPYDIDGKVKPILDALFLAAGRNDRDVDELLVRRRRPTRGGKILVEIWAYVEKE